MSEYTKSLKQKSELFDNWKVIRDNDLDILVNGIDDDYVDNVGITLIMYISELLCFNDIKSFDSDTDVIEVEKFKIYFQISEFFNFVYNNQNFFLLDKEELEDQ